MTSLEAALSYLEAGYSVVPIKPDGTKKSPLYWKEFQSRRMSPEEAQKEFYGQRGVAVICGEISDNLEVLDIDDVEILDRFVPIVECYVPDFRARVPFVRSPRGSGHFYYKLSTVGGNTTLALRAPPPGEDKPQTLIETRGEGGYAIAPGTPGACHKSGRPYVHESGPPITDAPLLTKDEHELLFAIAKSFDEMGEIVEESSPDGSDGRELRPGEDFAQKATWNEVLEPHGWTVHHERDGVVHWTRPGKNPKLGSSATTGFCKSKKTGEDLLRIFSSAAMPFEMGKAYGKFSAYALLNHAGDFKAAARELAARGYGDQKKSQATPAVREELIEHSASYETFPITFLPSIMAEYVEKTAAAIGCDVTHVAIPAMGVVAGAIGNTRIVLIKRTWLEPPILWGAVVARSGGWKSPALQAVLRPVYAIQAQALAQYEEEYREWEKVWNEYKDQMADYRMRKGEKPDPPEDPEPRLIEYIVDDITTESLALNLRDNPRGLLGAPEELSGHFGAMDAYKKGAHVDASRWLRMYDGRELKINRKTGARKDRVIFVRRAAVSLIGTVQVRILMRLATGEHFDSGMMARFMFAAPPLARPEWNEAEIPQELEERYEALLSGIYKLQGLRESWEEHLEEEHVQSMRPQVLYLTDSAKAKWIELFNDIRFEEDTEDLQQSALWAKTVGRAARIALVHHVVTEVSAGRDATAPVSPGSMEAGITIATWFLKEGERIYRMLRFEARKETGEDSGASQVSRHEDDDALCDWIASRSGVITPNQLRRGPRRYRKRDVDPEARLQGLVDRGRGDWEVRQPSGPGRPTRVFRLRAPASGDGIRETGDGIGVFSDENMNSVSIAASPGGEPSGRVPGDEPLEDLAEGGEEVTWEV